MRAELTNLFMSNKIAIESLSMDLLRVALGYHRGSINMAKRFSEESLKRINEINTSEIEPYFVKILTSIKNSLRNADENRIAEDTLMYSTLCKNYAKHFA